MTLPTHPNAQREIEDMAEAAAKPEPTVEQFIDWLRTKPADETYDALNSNMCALGQFGLSRVSLRNHAQYGLTQRVYEAAVYEPPFTFGALLERLTAEEAA